MASISYKPLYLQVREILLSRIDNGSYQQGEIIPSESVLAEEFGTSISTIRQAISMLAADGLLVKKQGKGTYVSDRKTTIRFWGWLDIRDLNESKRAQQAVLDSIDVFQNSYPSISVEYILSHDDSSPKELLHLITEGNAPDVVHIPSHWTSFFASLGALAPLEGLLNPKHLDNRFHKNDLYGGRYRDTLYSVAWGLCPVSLLGNKQVLQQAGIKLPDLPMTLDDFSAICQTLDGFYKGEDTYSYALSLSDGQKTDFLSVYAILQAFDGGFMTGQGETMLHSPENVEAFRWLRQFIKTCRVFQADIQTIRQKFVQGEIAFISDSSWMKGYVEELTGEPFEQNVEVVLNPIYRGVHSLSWTDNRGLAICSQSQHQAQAAKFIDVLTHDERVCHAFYAKTGMLPVSETHLDDSLYSSESFHRYKQQLMHTNYVNTQHPMFMKAMAFCSYAVKNILYERADIGQELQEAEKYLRMLYEE